MAVEINIIAGDKYSKFREMEELEFLGRILGKKEAERYVKGFQYYRDMTLEIIDEELVGSAAIEIQGGSFRIRELIITEPYNNEDTLFDAFEAIKEFAIKDGCHKMWLIDHPKLGRLEFYKKTSWLEEAKLEKNILGEDEYLMCKFITAEDVVLPRKTNLEIKIRTGKMHSDFRKREQLNFLKKVFGEKGQPYFEGFQKKEIMTLEIKENGNLIGSAGIEITDGLFRIRAFMIKMDYRGRGIGTKALEKMEEFAKSKRCHKMWLITNPQLRAVGLYKRRGWEIEGQLKNNVAKQDELLMRKYI